MLNIQFKKDMYEFSSVKEDDVVSLGEWIKSNNKDDKTCYSLDSQIFYRRFLEYYVTDNEVFIKIYKNNKILAVFKGRLELDRKKELFVWLFVIDGKLRNMGIGSEVIEIIFEHFKNEYKIESIEVGVVENNTGGISFWSNRKFKKVRSVLNFFKDKQEKGCNLVIMERGINSEHTEESK